MSEQYYFRINGMTCDGCVNKVEKNLQNLEGIEEYEVDLETGMAVVKASVSAQEITAAIDAAGYNAILVPE